MRPFISSLAVLLVVPGVAFGATVIDDFRDGSTLLLEPGSDEDGGLANVVGSVRRVDLEQWEGECWVNSDPYPGQAHLEKGFNSGVMTLSYGNKTASGGDLGLNWRSGGEITLRVVDPVNCMLEVTISSGATDCTPPPWDVTPGDFAIPLSDFSGLNLAQVDGLQFRFDVSGPNVLPGKVTVDSMETNAVAEPSAMILLLAGLVGLGIYGFRRRRRAAE